MNEDLDRQPAQSFLASIGEEGKSTGLLFWKVWWKSFAALAVILLFLFIPFGRGSFSDLQSDLIHLVIAIGFMLFWAANGAAIVALFRVAWKYLGFKALIPPIGALLGALMGASLIVAVTYLVTYLTVGDEHYGPQAHGGGHFVVLVVFLLIKFFALAGATLGGLVGVLMVCLFVLRERRSNRSCASSIGPTSELHAQERSNP